MPVVPHYPSDEPEEIDRAPDLDEMVDRILRREDGPVPTAAGT